MRVSLDFETRSAVDLRKTGVDRYAEDPSTSIWCLAYSLDGQRIDTWRIGEPDPAPLLKAVADGATITAWNAPFEAGIWHYTVRRLYPHWPQVRLEQWSCTMARALALALPGSLEQCAEALKLPIGKDKAGHRLMLKMCRPTTAWRKWEAGGEEGFCINCKQPRYAHPVSPELECPRFVPRYPEPGKWHDSPADLQRLTAYCKQDVATEMAIGERVAPLTPSERANWLLNETVNRRGIRLDLPKIGPALEVVALETKRLNTELRTVTNGTVPRVTNTARMLAWLSDELHPLPDLKKRTVATVLAQRVANPTVQRALEIRREAGRASVAKLKAMLACVNTDGRARGLLGYHTATTGRAAGRRIQVQNFVRAFLPAEDIAAVLALLDEASDATIEAIADAIRFGFADPIDAIASCLRSLIVASPGRVLIGGDYSNIEGRITAWLAEQDWKLQAFRDFDRGEGLDLYILSYARSFGADAATIKKSDPRRQLGKVTELSLGFGGGPFALLSMCLLYGMNVADIADATAAVTDRYVWEDTEDRYPENPDLQYGLSKHVWTGLRVVVDAWRDAHPYVVNFWYDLERCAISAVKERGAVFSIKSGLIRYRYNGHFLFAQLPSGRCLAYARPHLKEVPKMGGYGTRLALHYWGQGKKSKKWESRKAWYGLLAENCLAGGSKVLTHRGVLALADVQPTDRLWDGFEWVRHGGLMANGTQQTISIDGVRMTPDHRVLTCCGWRHAAQCEGLDRHTVRLPNSHSASGVNRQESSVGGSLRLRRRKSFNGSRVKRRPGAFLRVSTKSVAVRSQTYSRHVEASGVCRVAVNDRPVPTTDASIVAQLRRTRNNGMRRLAGIVRSVLARHGRDLPTGFDTRPKRQRRSLQQRQLPMGNVERAKPQQTRQRLDRHAMGPSDCNRSCGTFGYRENDVALPTKSRMPARPFILTAGRTEQVYDIVNCGPRHRFTVIGEKGPFIVHNCVQATARDVLFCGMHRVERAGYPIVLHVHDEMVTEVGHNFGSANELRRLMCEPEPWMTDLPVSAGTWRDVRYGKG